MIGNDINIIIPKDIAKVHHCLMLKFFDKANSCVLNKFRELFAVDRDGYLVPINLYAKILPSLKNGLKLIGLMKRLPTISLGP